MQYVFIENKISDCQEGAKLCLSSFFPDGEEVYNRQKHQLTCTHGRATYSLPFFKSKIQSLVVRGIIYKHILMRVMNN